MTHPLEIPDAQGNLRVEPSVTANVRIREAARFTGANPFVVTLLGQFAAGPVDEVVEHDSFPSFLVSRDPLRQGGRAVQIAKQAFQPGPGQSVRGASSVRTIRLGDGASVPVAASRTLDGASEGGVLTIEARDPGPIGNDFLVKFEQGSERGAGVPRGVKASINHSFQNEVVGDNLGPLFRLNYTGGDAEATMTIVAATPGAATLLTTATGPLGNTALDRSLDLTSEQFATVLDVVNYFRRQPGYTVDLLAPASLLTGLSSRELDAQSDLSLLPADSENTVTASLGALVWWINANAASIGGMAGVTAARVAAKAEPPAAMPGYLALQGGTQPAVGADDYEAALAVLERDDYRSGILVVDTSDTSLQDVVAAWLAARRDDGETWAAVFGASDTTSDDDADTRAALLDSRVVAHVVDGFIDENGETQDAVVAAGALAGATAGMRPAVDNQTLVLSQKPLRASSIQRARRRSAANRKERLKAGNNVVALLDGRVVWPLVVSTSQAKRRTDRMWSESMAIEFIRHSLLDTVRPTNVGWIEEQRLAMVQAVAMDQLDGWAEAGVITEGVAVDGGRLPAYLPPQASVNNGATSLVVQVHMAGENDHTTIDLEVAKVSLVAA